MNGKSLRAALSLLMVGLYAAGLIAMLLGHFMPGLYLWAISTLGGIALLYWIHVMKKRAEDAEKIARGMPYGEPDDPEKPVEPVAPPKEDEGA